jgi:uncharacterized protein (DUF486 family)
VWPIEISQRTPVQSNLAQLDDRVLRILHPVPANRIGSYEFNAAQLKTIQEVITLVVFSAFSVFHLKQSIRSNHIAGFGMIISASA